MRKRSVARFFCYSLRHKFYQSKAAASTVFLSEQRVHRKEPRQTKNPSTLKKLWTDLLFHATMRLDRVSIAITGDDEVGTSGKGGGSMKIDLKPLKRVAKRLSKVDWKFWLEVGTFLATLYGALK